MKFRKVLFVATTCFLLSFVPAPAATIASARSGGWGSASTWAGGVVPGAGDTVSISDNHTVTVADARSVGASAGAGSVAIRLNNSGALEIGAAGILDVRGDTRFTGSADAGGKDAVTVQPGGIWEFDSTQGAKTSYTFGPEMNGGFRRFVAKGTAQDYATVRSKPGGANGRFTLNGHVGGGALLAAYTTFFHIGDAATPGWQVSYEYSGAHLVKWQVTDSNFIGCGVVASANSIGVDDNGTFVHNDNVHRNSATTEVFSKWINITTVAPGTGIREIRGNVFDTAMSRSAFYPGGFTITGNYFGDATMTEGYNPWALVSGNFIRFTDAWGAAGHWTRVLGDLQHTYLFVDSDWGNPKPIGSAPWLPGDLNGVIFGQAGTAVGPPGGPDSGELTWNTNPLSVTTYGLYNSIILPNMNGHASLEMGAPTLYFPNLRVVAEHNTWFGGWGGGTRQGQPGFPAVQVGESGNAAAGIVISFRSNILWNPQLSGYPSSFFKLADISNSPTPTPNYCSPANCDYNTGFGHTVADTAHPQFTNQGKGYAAKFSSPPGVHDVDTDPKFFDWQRSVELFDSKYLGNKPAAWAVSAKYKAGDFVQSSDPTVYWTLPVNFRYVNDGNCRNTNPKPGTGVHWRECWEWASLYRLRQGVGEKQIFNDPLIGARRDDIISTMIKWVRAGYAPANKGLLDAAHDGYDIGAVQSCLSRRSQAVKTGAGGVCAPSLKEFRNAKKLP